MAGPGQTGFNALGEILAGGVNPSAKMVDTYVYDLTQTPTWNNFGSMFYDNMDEFAVDGAVPSFVNYVEGIYVGYKFYETAADEGLINYDDTVMFPFGYGLSYTSFAYSELKADARSVTLTVTNTGSRAGAEIVQVYAAKPDAQTSAPRRS